MSLETIDLQHLQLNADEHVLDLGCGEGRHAISATLCAAVRVVGVDLALNDLHTARARLKDFAGAEAACAFACADGTRLPFADGTFDTVICAEVLEHVPDHHAMLAEIRRVLKPGGRLAVSVPRFFPEWVCWRLSRAYHEVPGGHVRIFRARKLRQAVEAQAMRFTRRHWAHSLHVPYWWLRCLFWRRGDQVLPVRLYHRLLVWDLMRSPALTRGLDRLLNPLMGKSIVMYFVRES